MTDPLTNSMNQVSEKEKRRKRLAELQAKLNEYERAMRNARSFFGTSAKFSPFGSNKSFSMAEYNKLQREFDSLNY